MVGDFAYFKGNYNLAAEKYEECLVKMGPRITGVKREVMENLSRSYIKQGCFEEAEEWAYNLVSISFLINSMMIDFLFAKSLFFSLNLAV